MLPNITLIELGYLALVAIGIYSFIRCVRALAFWNSEAVWDDGFRTRSDGTKSPWRIVSVDDGWVTLSARAGFCENVEHTMRKKHYERLTGRALPDIVKRCGNDDCRVSGGIFGSMTFGSGALDRNGYWEHGCEACARWHEIVYPENGECWPFDTAAMRELQKLVTGCADEFEALGKQMYRAPSSAHAFGTAIDLGDLPKDVAPVELHAAGVAVDVEQHFGNPFSAVPTPARPGKDSTLTSEQIEIKRLRRVLHSIADSRPDEFMDSQREPELVEWICETCRKASVGAYPPEGESFTDHVAWIRERLNEDLRERNAAEYERRRAAWLSSASEKGEYSKTVTGREPRMSDRETTSDDYGLARGRKDRHLNGTSNNTLQRTHNT